MGSKLILELVFLNDFIHIPVKNAPIFYIVLPPKKLWERLKPNGMRQTNWFYILAQSLTSCLFLGNALKSHVSSLKYFNSLNLRPLTKKQVIILYHGKKKMLPIKLWHAIKLLKTHSDYRDIKNGGGGGAKTWYMVL